MRGTHFLRHVRKRTQICVHRTHPGRTQNEFDQDVYGVHKFRTSSNMPPRQPPRPRSKGFSEAELDFLLETIEQHLPIGGMEWDQVESQHQAAFK